ncbi:MAG TPA: TIGR02266 family protein [Kofleriaceae bacterium]|nr:TIGR02266 family protein [Kofleriaceae bacterium]
MSDDDGDSGPNDKRRHARAPITLRVEYDGADDLVGDYTDNLSHGGTFVATSRSLPLGTEVRLVLSFRGLLAPITIDGVVRWVRPEHDDEQPGVGIEFTNGPDRERMQELIDKIRKRDPRLVSRVLKVLVVEDNAHVADLIRDGLRGSSKRGFDDPLQFDFRMATNGREAIDTLRAETFDLAIVDVYLPIMDGGQVIAAAREELGLKQMPIIAVSAGGESAKRQAMAAGADMFLDKPMRLRQVIDTMRRLMKL